MKIRRFTNVPTDLVDLFVKLNKEMNNDSPARVKYGEDCFHDIGEMTDAFIVYKGKRPIGCSILKKQSKEVGIITNIYVAPEYRRQGICMMMFNAVETQARARGHVLLIGDTWGELGPMKAAYENTDSPDTLSNPPPRGKGAITTRK